MPHGQMLIILSGLPGTGKTTIARELARPDAIVAVYGRQLDELESDRRHGLFTDDEFLVERDDLERRVIGDVAEPSPLDDRARPTAHATRLRYILAVGMPLAAAVLYLALGAPHVISQAP
jgi:cytochrome c-type biogenesis protein CcmI